MPFEIVRNDIVNMQVDAIVNTANPKPLIGYGTDSGIHKKAGPGLLKARRKIGKIGVGQAATTPGFDLDSRFVIHTVGPVWKGGAYDEEELLASCYRKSLALAKDNNCESIAFPLISTGNYDFPKLWILKKCFKIWIQAFPKHFSNSSIGQEKRTLISIRRPM